ncbi:MAG TPA: hypothetical protein PL033_06780 [Candidatus Brocadiia bacterium]|nr:hypothetical protein [Candidatus Brocadiia bacterium]
MDKAEAAAMPDAGAPKSDRGRDRIIVMAAAWMLVIALCYAQRWADPDVWGHLLFGRDYIRAGRVLTADPYSYTAFKAPWHGHEPLFEVSFWLAYDLFGSFGLVAAKTAFGAGAILLTWLAFRRGCRQLWIEAAVLIMTAHLAAFFFQCRPQIYTYLGMGAYVFLLDTSARDGKWKKLLLLPIIMLPWANAHGGFFAGLGLGALYFTGGAIEAVKSPSEQRAAAVKRLGVLAAAMTASALASLANPIGIDLWRTFFRAIGNPMTRKFITEWGPAIPWAGSLKESLGGLHVQENFYLMNAAVLIVVVIAATGTGKLTPTDYIIAVVGVLLPMHGYRHIPLFAIMCAPVIARAMEAGFAEEGDTTTDAKGLPPAQSRWPMIFCIFAVLPAVVGLVRYIGDHPAPSLNILHPTPCRAVRFIREAGLKGNIYCEYNWGEYLIWQLGDTCKVSMDGRYDTIYPMDVLDKHMEFFMEPRGPESITIPELYDTDMILIMGGRNMAAQLQIPSERARMKHEWILLLDDTIEVEEVRGGRRAMVEKDLSYLYVRKDRLDPARMDEYKAIAERIRKEPYPDIFPTINDKPVMVDIGPALKRAGNSK